MRSRVETTQQHDAATKKMIFRFEVQLLSGPVAPSFAGRHPEAPSRSIDIRGSQTLDALHQAIFKAFDREDAHMYEFQIGGKKPMDKKAVRYSIALDGEDPEEKNAETTTIAALKLKVRNSFFYWFDFGDDWWHVVRLLSINPPEKGRERYPRIVERKGESPPQYIDWEAMEDELDLNATDALAAQTIQRIEDACAIVAQQRRDEIFALIKDFCKTRLTEGYGTVCEDLLESAYGARLPLERGKAQSWAAGIVHAAGTINFLHDPATEPYMKLRDIAQHFGVSPATMENKSREIRDAVNSFPLDPRFCLPECLLDNPHVWLRQINGIFVDFRTQPREAQEAALKAGLIPFIPETPVVIVSQKQEEKTKKQNSKTKPEKAQKKPDQYGLLE